MWEGQPSWWQGSSTVKTVGRTQCTMARAERSSPSNVTECSAYLP